MKNIEIRLHAKIECVFRYLKNLQKCKSCISKMYKNTLNVCPILQGKLHAMANWQRMQQQCDSGW